MQRQRNAAAGERGMLGQAEQLLHAQRDRRARLRLRSRSAAAVPVGAMKWVGASLIEAPRQIPGQQRVQRLGEVVRADVVEARLADEKRREPVGDRRPSASSRKVRPRLAFGATQEHHPVAPLLERSCVQGRRASAERKNAARERERAASSAGTAKRLLGEDRARRAATAARPQRAEARSKISSSPVSIERRRPARCRRA